MQIVRLSNIPPIIQKKYNIGSETDVLSNGIRGHLTAINKDGHEVLIDAVVLTKYQITIDERR